MSGPDSKPQAIVGKNDLNKFVAGCIKPEGVVGGVASYHPAYKREEVINHTMEIMNLSPVSADLVTYGVLDIPGMEISFPREFREIVITRGDLKTPRPTAAVMSEPTEHPTAIVVLRSSTVSAIHCPKIIGGLLSADADVGPGRAFLATLASLNEDPEFRSKVESHKITTDNVNECVRDILERYHVVAFYFSHHDRPPWDSYDVEDEDEGDDDDGPDEPIGDGPCEPIKDGRPLNHGNHLSAALLIMRGSRGTLRHLDFNFMYVGPEKALEKFTHTGPSCPPRFQSVVECENAVGSGFWGSIEAEFGGAGVEFPLLESLRINARVVYSAVRGDRLAKRGSTNGLWTIESEYTHVTLTLSGAFPSLKELSAGASCDLTVAPPAGWGGVADGHDVSYSALAWTEKMFDDGGDDDDADGQRPSAKKNKKRRSCGGGKGGKRSLRKV